MKIFKRPLTAAEIKAKARELGADLVGIADGRNIDTSHITEHDGGRVIVLATRVQAGSSRIPKWNDRNKYYNDELSLTFLEEVSLELVYWLEDAGYPALIVPPTHVDPWRYKGDPKAHQQTLISLPHAAVEAGLGTLGLNLQLLTPQYGPRVLLTAVLCSVDVECDRPMTEALCLGPECGRCLKACPGDVIRQWDRDWEACDRYRSPHGFAQLSEYLGRVIDEPEAEEGDAALGRQLQPLAEHPARRGRDHRLPALRRRLPGRRGLRPDAQGRARLDRREYAREGGASRRDGRVRALGAVPAPNPLDRT